MQKEFLHWRDFFLAWCVWNELTVGSIIIGSIAWKYLHFQPVNLWSREISLSRFFALFSVRSASVSSFSEKFFTHFLTFFCFIAQHSFAMFGQTLENICFKHNLLCSMQKELPIMTQHLKSRMFGGREKSRKMWWSRAQAINNRFSKWFLMQTERYRIYFRDARVRPFFVYWIFNWHSLRVVYSTKSLGWYSKS